LSRRAYAEKGDIAETKDIWEKKPKPNSHPLIQEPSDHWYERFNMDAWLEKVKVEYDDMRQTLLSMDAVKIKISDEIREKAQKLEAVKTYLDDNYLSTTHLTPVIDIRKILEAEG